MTPPSNNRYDRLSDLNEPNADGNIFEDESWVQAPDGSWIRSTDKVAEKLRRKGKLRPSVQPAVAPPPPPPPAAPEPPRRLNRKAAAEQQSAPPPAKSAAPPPPEKPAKPAKPVKLSRAEKQRQAELERQAELDRQAELERQRRAELERQLLAERERQAELDRQGRAEMERAAELDRVAELERRRAADLLREVELERARVAELEREVELERQRQADLTLNRRNGSRQPDPDDGTYWREPEADSGSWFQPAQPAPRDAKHAAKLKPPKQPKPKPEPKVHPAHERHGAGHGAGHRALGAATAAVMVLVALLLGAGINWLGPDLAGAQRPFTKSGALNQGLDARTFTVTVQAARVAPALQIGKAAQTTQGAWVIVRVHLVANAEPVHVGYVALRDRAGRTFLATDRIRQPLLDGARTFQPGIVLEGDVVFEVPKDALAGLTALFAAQAGMDAMAAVDLPALNLTDGQPPATLAPTEVKA